MRNSQIYAVRWPACVDIHDCIPVVDCTSTGGGSMSSKRALPSAISSLTHRTGGVGSVDVDVRNLVSVRDYKMV